jgi:hypothetical protein
MGLSFRILFLVLLCSTAVIPESMALTMKGRVFDYKTNEPMPNVNVVNTFTDRGITTDSSGLFTIEVELGHLVEFRRIGYKISRVRIEQTQLPYYNIAMKEGAIDLMEVEITGNNYKLDSIEKRETYKWAIEHYKLTGLDVIQHPFDALSKRNRQIWAFQKHYEYFEKEKFINYVFNERLIRQLTKMDSTSTAEYMRYYRPSYEQLKSWSEYEFYEFIKRTATAYIRRRE